MDEMKNRIMETAKKEFLRDGYSRVKTEDIAKILGISKRTLYKHFPSKKGLFERIVRDGLEEERLKTKAIMDRMRSEDGDIIDELRNIWESVINSQIHISRTFFDDIRKVLPKMWAEIVEFSERDMKNKFKKMYEKGIKQGIFCPEINKELVFLIHHHTLRNIFTSEQFQTMNMSLRDLMTQFFEIIFLGIMKTDAKQRLLDKFSDYDEYTKKINNIN